MTCRAGIIVTGTEVLTGRVADRNGPWLAEQLRTQGVDVAHVIVVGDRTEDLESALSFLRDSGADLIITSGGLGPTADDLTAEVVANFQGRPLSVDPELERQIGEIIQRLSAGRGWRVDASATAAATRKQAVVPAGATVLPPVGTAPGLVVPPHTGSGAPVIVLPGPPGELRPMWPSALEVAEVRRALAGRAELRQETIRLWGTPESELSATLREQAGRISGLEITTCLRDGELEIVTRFCADAQPSYDRLAEVLTSRYRSTLLSADGSTIDDLVAGALTGAGLTIATAESCTAGLLAARLTQRPGSSAYLTAGLVTYSNEAKTQLLGVPAELIDSVGAVSAEVAEAMADGVRARVGADVGIAITGVAGPGGATATKPVGLVHFCAVGPGSRHAREVRIPGDRRDVRTRAVTVAMHLIRRTLRDVPGSRRDS